MGRQRLRLVERDPHQPGQHAPVAPVRRRALRRRAALAGDAVQQLPVPVRVPAVRARRLVAPAREAAPARVPDRRVVVLLRLVGLALPASADRRDIGRLRRRALDLPHRGRAPPPAAAHCVADDEHRHPRLLQVRGLLPRHAHGIGSGLGLPPDLATLHIVLPIGISFYTFNSMSYTIDIFRRRIEPTRNVLEYTTFVALFPHLIAGPIVRFTDLADAAAPADAAADLTPRGARRLLPLLRPRQEAPDRRPAPPLREPSLLRPRPPRLAHGLGGRDRLLAAALLRLLRLLGHGRRARLAARLPLPAELQLALQGGEHLRLLATLAHEPVLVVSGLPVHPPRRLTPRSPSGRS